MTNITDLTKLSDEFVFHFGGEFNQISVETFANSLLEFSSAMKEINRIINPGFEMKVYVEALGNGSFRARIKTFLKNISPLLDDVPKTLILALLANFMYEKIFPAKYDVDIIVNDESYIFEAGENRIILPKEVEKERKKVTNNSDVEKCVSKAFRFLDEDPEIENFGITENLEDKKPIVQIPRSDFPRLIESYEINYNEEERHRHKDEETNLLIIRAIFESGNRKWQFVWQDGILVSAPILDKSFFDKLLSHEYVIGTGDVLQVILRIYQQKDEISGIWLNRNYEVLKVINHTPGPQQLTIGNK